jgi:hypothetical protein
MIISEKQHAANQRNALYSTGPKSPYGKEAVRLNALTWGLRSRFLIVPGEDPADYRRLCDEMEAEWQPQTPSEWLALEQMSTSIWLQGRLAQRLNWVYGNDYPLQTELDRTHSISAQRVRLENSYAKALKQLEHLKQTRQTRAPQPQPQPPKPAPAHPPTPPAPYVMSEPPEAPPLTCAPATDTR